MPGDINLDIKFSPELNIQALNTVLKHIKEAFGPMGQSISFLDEKKIKADLAIVGRELKKTFDSIPDSKVKFPTPDTEKLKTSVSLTEQYEINLRESRAAYERSRAVIAATNQALNEGKTLTQKQREEYQKATREINNQKNALDAAEKSHSQILANLKQENTLGDSLTQDAQRLKTAYESNVKTILAANVAKKQGKTLTDQERIAVERATQEVKEQKTQLELIEKEQREINKQFQLGGQALDQAKTKASGFMKVLAVSGGLQIAQMVTGSIDQFLQPFIELDKQVQNIGTLGVKNLKEIQAASSDLSVTIPDDAATIAEGLYQAVSAGTVPVKNGLVDVASAMDFVEIASKAGVAGLSDTKSAVDGLTSVLNAYGKSVDDADTVASTFFGGIKLGKTSFEELNSSIATFVPLAAASGVSFEEATSAIASMTAMGTPTAQAATQIRAAMVLIQKGGPGLNKVLKANGLSLREFQEQVAKDPDEGGGLVNTLQRIRGLVEEAGMTLPQATGRIEASSAILQLTGENLKGTQDTFNNLKFEVSQDAASKAFDVAAESVSAKSAGLLSTIQAQFNKMFTALGKDAAALMTTFNQIAPALMGVGAIGSFIPEGAFGKAKNFASTLLTKLSPALKATQGAAGAASMGLKALSTAFLTNPFVLAIAGAAALVAGLHALSNALHETAQERLDDVEAQQEALDKQIELNEAQQGQAEATIAAAERYKTLKKEHDGTVESTKRLNDAALALNSRYPGLIDGTETYEEVVKKLDGTIAESKGRLDELGESMSDLENNKVRLDFENLKLQSEVKAEELTDLMSDATGIWSDSVAEFLTGTSTAKQQSINALNDYKQKIYEATNEQDLVAAVGEMQNALFNDPAFTDIPPDAKAKMIDSIQEFGDSRVELLEMAAQQAAATGGKIEDYLPAPPKEMSEGWNNTLKEILGFFPSIFSVIINFKDYWDSFTATINNTVAYIKGFGEAIYENFEYPIDVAVGLARTISEEVGKFGQALNGLFSGSSDVKQDIQDVSDSIKNFKDSISGFINSITSKIAALMNWFARLRASIDNFLSNGVDKFLQKFPFLSAVIEPVRQALQKFLGWIDKVSGGVGGFIQKIGGFIDGLAKKGKIPPEAQKSVAEFKKLQEEQTEQTQDSAVALDEETDAFDANTASTEKDAKSKETLFQKRKALFDLAKEGIENEKNYADIVADGLIVQQERTKNVYDEIAAAERNADAIEKQKQKMIELFDLELNEKGDIVRDEEGNVKIGIKLDKGEKEKAQQEVNNLATSFASEQAQAVNLRAKLNLDVKESSEELNEKTRQLDLEKLKFDIDIGLKSNADLKEFYEEDLAELRNELGDLRNQEFFLKFKMKTATDADARLMYEAQLLDVQNKLADVEKKELDGRKKVQSVTEKINAETAEDIRTRYDLEIKALEDRYGTELDFLDMIVSATERASQTKLERQYDGDTENLKKLRDNELSELERLKDDKLLTDEEYNEKKADLDEKYQDREDELLRKHENRLQSIEAMANGYRFEAERQADIQILEKKREAKDAELMLALESGDAEKATDLWAELDDITVALDEKKNVLLAYKGEMQGAMTDVFSAMFAGNGEDMRDGFREMFGIIAGALKNYLGAIVTKMVLDQLGIVSTGTGIGALLFAPAITALVNAGLSAIVDPVLANLLSFSTGGELPGRYDNPTAIVLGDASKARPGSDTEWVFRDDQIAALLDRGLARFSGVVLREIQNSNSELGIKFNALSEKVAKQVGELSSNFALTEFLTRNSIQKDVSIQKLSEQNIINKEQYEKFVESLKNFENRTDLKSDIETNRIETQRIEDVLLKREKLSEERNIERIEELIRKNEINHDEYNNYVESLKNLSILNKASLSELTRRSIENVENILIGNRIIETASDNRILTESERKYDALRRNVANIQTMQIAAENRLNDVPEDLVRLANALVEVKVQVEKGLTFEEGAEKVLTESFTGQTTEIRETVQKLTNYIESAGIDEATIDEFRTAENRIVEVNTSYVAGQMSKSDYEAALAEIETARNEVMNLIPRFDIPALESFSPEAVEAMRESRTIETQGIRQDITELRSLTERQARTIEGHKRENQGQLQENHEQLLKVVEYLAGIFGDSKASRELLSEIRDKPTTIAIDREPIGRAVDRYNRDKSRRKRGLARFV